MRRSESDVSGFFADLYGWVGSATVFGEDYNHKDLEELTRRRNNNA